MKRILFTLFVFVSTLSADLVIDGLSSGDLIFGSSSQIIVENTHTLTLRNLTVKNLSGDRIVMEGTESKLALEDVVIWLDGDYSFTQGHLYIHDDVCISGTSTFAYQSGQQSYINQYSTLYLDFDTTFSYDSKVANRTLIDMYNRTSKMHCNGCTLYSTPTGLMLTKGTMIFENLVTLSADGQVSSEAISLGNPDGDDLATKFLSGARVETYGKIDGK